MRLLAALGLVAVIFALGENTPVLPALRKIFPQLGFVTYPVKWLLLLTFIAPLLAAFSLARFQKCNFQKQIAPVGTILFLLLAAILFWAWRFPFPTDEVHATLLNGISRAVFLILTGAVLFVLARKSESKIFRSAPLVLIFVVWLDVLTHEPTQNPTVTPNVYGLNLARIKLAMNPQPELGGSRAMVSPKAFMEFIQLALREPKNNFLAKRLGYCANCNLLDAVPKVDGFFSLTPRESDDLFSLLYGATNEFPQLENFLGVSQITAPDEIYHWQSRSDFLPLVTAGQKPIFLDDADTLRALTKNNFDGSKMVFLPPEAKSLVTVSNQTSAKILNSKFGTQSVEIEVAAAEPSLVVVAQTFYHNWRAFVDGKATPILRANHAFQAIQIPQGNHRIRLIYKDRAFEIGAVVSVAAWLDCLLGGIFLKKKLTNRKLAD
jgi:Bacterial membrane protein YfhO